MSALNAELLRGLFDTMPRSEQEKFLSALPVVATVRSTPTKLLTMKEVAICFGCTARTVQRWVQIGELPAIKRGRLVRIPEEAVYSIHNNPRAKEKIKEVRRG
jgi:excisionase family DNA binding protein